MVLRVQKVIGSRSISTGFLDAQGLILQEVRLRIDKKKMSAHFVWALYTFSSGLNTRVTVFRGTPVFTDTEIIGIKRFQKNSNLWSLKLHIHSLSLLRFLVSESGSRSAPSTPPDDESDELPPKFFFRN